MSANVCGAKMVHLLHADAETIRRPGANRPIRPRGATTRRTAHVHRDHPERCRARRRDQRCRSGPTPRRRRVRRDRARPERSRRYLVPRPANHPTPQVAFTRRFGETEFNILANVWSVPGSPEIVVVSNVARMAARSASDAGENWHSDMCYAARPSRGTMPYALEVPCLYGLTLGDRPEPGGLPVSSRGGRPGGAQGTRDDQGRDNSPALFSPQVLDGSATGAILSP
jgi:hypothetical protein